MASFVSLFLSLRDDSRSSSLISMSSSNPSSSKLSSASSISCFVALLPKLRTGVSFTPGTFLFSSDELLSLFTRTFSFSLWRVFSFFSELFFSFFSLLSFLPLSSSLLFKGGPPSFKCPSEGTGAPRWRLATSRRSMKAPEHTLSALTAASSWKTSRRFVWRVHLMRDKVRQATQGSPLNRLQRLQIIQCLNRNAMVQDIQVDVLTPEGGLSYIYIYMFFQTLMRNLFHLCFFYPKCVIISKNYPITTSASKQLTYFLQHNQLPQDKPSHSWTAISSSTEA